MRLSKPISAADREQWCLVAILAGAAVLMAWGIWRVAPHRVLGDEASTIAQSLRMLFHGPWTPKFDRLGNFHLWLLMLLYIPLSGYWLLIGRGGAVAEGSAVYAHSKPWGPGELLNGFYDALLVGRALSVVAGIATVYLAYRVARDVTDRRGGLWAGGVLTVMLGFSLTAKYAAEDVPQAFLVLLALFLLVRLAGEWDESTAVYAALVTGAAIGMKASSGLLVIPFAAVVLARWRERRDTWARDAGLSGGLAAGAYVLSTPSLVVYPHAWIDYLLTYLGWFSDMGDILNHYPDPSWLTVIGHAAVALGLPLLVVAGIAWAAVAYWSATGRVDRRVGLLYAVAVPYAGMLCIGRLTSYFRVVPLLPLTAVIIAIAIHHATATDRAWLRHGVRAGMAVVLVFSLVYTGTAAASYSQSRQEATEYVDTLPAGSDVGVLAHRIYLPEFPDRVTVHRYRENITNGSERARALTTFREACHEYVVLSSFHYFRYVRSPGVRPAIADTIRGLLAERQYRIVRRFGPPVVTDYDAERKVRESTTVVHRARTNGNPTIVVLERTGEPGASCQ